MPVDTALIEALLAPVPGDHPAGKDLRYDPRYDQVKEARREDLELPAGGLATERKLADWVQVTKLARGLLETETKDLQLAAWLTEALLRRDGLSGLATGLDTIRGILERYWDGCYPEWDEEDPELRAGAIDWLGKPKFELTVRQSVLVAPGVSLSDLEVSRTVPTETEAEGNKDKRATRTEKLAEGKPAPEEVDRAIAAAPKAFYKTAVAEADAALASLTGLEQSCDEKFGRDATSFGRLRAVLDETRRMTAAVLAQKLIEDPDPIVEIPAEGEVGAYEPPAGWQADGEGGMPAEPVSVADATMRVAIAARFLRKQDPTNPAPYLMLRGLRWGELRARGDGLDPKQLDAPPTAVRTRLKGLLLDAKWPDLLEQCEVVMATPQGRGWLDLQRYALTACANLGSGYDAIAAGVRSELRALIATFPRLPETTLMDDTPTANPETQEWLAAEGLTAAARPAYAAPLTDSVSDHTRSMNAALAEDDATSAHGGLRTVGRRRADGTGAAPDPFEQARAELAGGRPNRAIELLLAELARERSPRGRFVRQTQIAYVMVEAGHHAVARPILEKLVSTIDERSLEDWEAGPLVAQPMALLCRVIDKLEDSYAAEQRSGLYLRVCRLDPLQAIALPSA